MSPILTLELLGVLAEMRHNYPADHNDAGEIRRGRAERRKGARR